MDAADGRKAAIALPRSADFRHESRVTSVVERVKVSTLDKKRKEAEGLDHHEADDEREAHRG